MIKVSFSFEYYSIYAIHLNDKRFYFLTSSQLNSNIAKLMNEV